VARTGGAELWASPGDGAGLLLMVASAFLFSLMAALAKLILPDTPTQAVVLSRGVLMTAVFTAMAWRSGVSLLGSRPRTLFLRGLLGYGAVSCYFYSVQHLPIGDAVLLQYSHPVFVAVLAPLFLREATGRWHWPLVLLALLGVGLIVGPSHQLGTGALVGLSGSVLSGFAYMTVRDLSRTEHPFTILFWFPAVTIPGALVGAIHGGAASLPRGWNDVLGHLAVITCAIVGQLALTAGLARAGAARATAVTMSGPVFGLGLGWLCFDTVPTWSSAAGTALVIGSLLLLAAARRES
jgi:drug/metabolite transporter (DMT)-like permease